MAQHPSVANPPTLFLPLMKVALAVSGDASAAGLLQDPHTAVIAREHWVDFLHRAWPRLKLWLSWLDFQAGAVPSSYRCAAKPDRYCACPRSAMPQLRRLRLPRTQPPPRIFLQASVTAKESPWQQQVHDTPHQHPEFELRRLVHDRACTARTPCTQPAATAPDRCTQVMAPPALQAPLRRFRCGRAEVAGCGVRLASMQVARPRGQRPPAQPADAGIGPGRLPACEPPLHAGAPR